LGRVVCIPHPLDLPLERGGVKQFPPLMLNLLDPTRYLARFGGLFLHADYMRMWWSLAGAAFGGQIAMLAIPLTAAILLNATPFQMGLLIALETLPFALLALPSGVWVDRMNQLAIIRAADLARVFLLLIIPIATWLGHLSMTLMCIVGFLLGCCEVVGGSAYQVLMSRIVGRERLTEAHAKSAFAYSSAQVAGPGLAGALVQWLTAPFALVLVSLSFAFSFIVLRRVAPVAPTEQSSQEPMWPLIKEGLKLIWESPVLRSLAWTVALWQLLHYVYQAVIILFATRELGLSPGVVGVVYMLSGAGSLLGAVYAERASKQFGVGGVIVGALALTAVAWEFLPFINQTQTIVSSTLSSTVQTLAPVGATDSVRPIIQLATQQKWLSALLLGIGLFTFGFGATMFSVNYLALRQAVTPEHMLGRMTSTMRGITVAAGPIGSILGGSLATLIGLAATLTFAGAMGFVLAVVMWYLTPLASVKQMPGAQ
jgi:MFS family permease